MKDAGAIGLEILNEVARISTSTLDLDEILKQTIEVIASKMQIDAAAIYLIDSDDDHPRLKLKASIGLPEKEASRVYLPLGKGITGWVAEHKTPLVLNEALQDPRFVYFKEIEEERFQSMLSVPLLDRDDCMGVVNVHTIQKRFFNPSETTILETLCGQITGCLRNAIEFRRSQSLLREQTLLYEISLAVQSANKLDHRLWLLLSGITMGPAGGFNRAILFLLNEEFQTIRGYMGIGPASREDANRIWEELQNHSGDLLEQVTQNPNPEAYKLTPFHQCILNLSLPFEAGENPVADCILQNRALLGEHYPMKPGGKLPPPLNVEEYAVVPLVARNVPLGAVWVDNCYNQNPIQPNYLKLVVRLANQAGWVIENSRLFGKLLESNRELLSTKEQLIQSEKLAALGEMSAEVAHEIKNPLVSIGGFARRLQSKMKALANKSGDHKNELESAHQYSSIIVNEVERLETLLKNILVFSKSGIRSFQEYPLENMFKEVLKFFEPEIQQRNINIESEVEPGLAPLWGEPEQLKQVMVNLVFNSLESMPEGGQLVLSGKKDTGDSLVDRAEIIVQDTGGGIPPEHFSNIFNPFFTTKEAGTGLGLSISRKIIENHGGAIQLENNLDQGVTVHLYLPLKKVGDYNTTG